MYNFLVVEDEKHIRSTVAAILKELGSANVFEAENGVAALKVMETASIDAIILDIRMPVMDGISLLKKLYARKDSVTLAVLSGYDEFDYAQIAMEYGSLDYVLKPFNRDAIVKLYYKMVREINGRKSLASEIDELRHRMYEIRPFMKQRFFSDLLGGQVEERTLDETRKFLGLQLRNEPIRIFALEIDNTLSWDSRAGSEDRLNLYKLTEIIEQIVSKWPNCDCFEVSSNMLALIWCPPNGDCTISPEILQSIELLMNEMQDLYKVVLNVGISQEVDGPLKASQALESAKASIKYKLLYGSGQIFDAADIDTRADGNDHFYRLEEIIENIWLNKPDEALRLIGILFENMRPENIGGELTDPEVGLSQHKSNQKVLPLATMRLLMQKLLVDSLLVLVREGRSLDEFFKNEGIDLLDVKFANHSFSEVLAFFHSLIKSICNEISKTRISECKSIIVRVKRIIDEHYAEDLSIERLSKELHYSKNYLGQLFKSETGMTLNEYVNLVRIQRAKKLLTANDYKIYQVAEKVGFNDQQYFAKIFKKVVGCMPSEYRA